MSFTPLSPLVQLPGTPHLWLKLDFPLKGEVFRSRRNSQRNEYKSPAKLSIEQIPQGTNRGTMNFFPWTTSSMNTVLTQQKKKKEKEKKKRKTKQTLKSMNKSIRGRYESRDKEYQLCTLLLADAPADLSKTKGNQRTIFCSTTPKK